MDQKKIGMFFRELRKEKALTQEQLAEQFNVSNRSVSRWENGSNLPDLSLLVQLADFYDVDIRELIDGERKSEKMNQDEKATLLKVADYSENERMLLLKRVRIISMTGLASIILGLLFMGFALGERSPVLLCLEGIFFGLAIGALLTCVFYTTGVLAKLRGNETARLAMRILVIVFPIILIICLAACLILGAFG